MPLVAGDGGEQDGLARVGPPPGEGPATSAASIRFLPWLLLLFLGSGCAALIYEVVWLQLLQLAIGLTTISLGVLLGTYMGGMCLGSLLLARVVGCRRHPLRVYAALEAGIGLIGLASLYVVPWVSGVYAQWAGGGFRSLALRGLVAGLCLAPPTVLMGATLPAMARWVESTPRGVAWLGFFYGGNIAGAVFGCLLAGFYLLRVYDMRTATCVAAALNGAVALGGWLLAACAPGPRVADEQRETRAEPAPGRTWVYLAIAFSGLTALGAEVVWTRLLSLIMGGTVYTFSIILAVFLAGLGMGSGVGSFVSRWTRAPALALAGCQAALAGAVAWTAYSLADSLPHWPINPSLASNPWFTFQLDLARCSWAVLPAALLWGASFPLALAAVGSTGGDPGRVVGRVYGANTVGAIAGALGFSLLVVPLGGTQWAQRLLAGLCAVGAVAALAAHERQACRPGRGSPGLRMRPALVRWAGGALAAVGLASMAAWSVPATPWGVVAYGRFMATYGRRLAPGIVPENAVPTNGGGPDIYCLFLGEGLNGSVAVTQWSSGERNFHSAGKVQASTEARDMRLQRLLGHLAALVHPKPESALVVACGAGVTAGTFTQHPSVQRIVICDIEPLVPRRVAPLFEQENHGVLKDPRTQVVLDDGRHFLQTTRERFDIVTSDPIDPWVKGCAALNTLEYYEMAKTHLKPGGVMALWIPLYECNLATAKSVIATFFAAFPHGTLWTNDSEGEGYDAVLLGQVAPTMIDLDRLQERLRRANHAGVAKSLADVGFRSAIELLATYAGRAEDLKSWTREAELNRDVNLRLQYLAGMWLNSFMGTEIREDLRRHYRFPGELFVGSHARVQSLKYAMEALPPAESPAPAQPPAK